MQALGVCLVENGFIELGAWKDPVVQAGFDHWRRLKGTRAFPSRQKIGPREMSGLLRNALLVRVLDGGDDYEVLIQGEAHTRAIQINMQGGQLRDLRRVWPGLAESLQKVYGMVLKSREPVAIRAFREDCPGFNPIASEHVVLPLGESDYSVDHILVFSVYSPIGTPA